LNNYIKYIVKKGSLLNEPFFSIVKNWTIWFLVLVVFQLISIWSSLIDTSRVGINVLILAGLKQHVSAASYITLLSIFIGTLRFMSLKIYALLSRFSTGFILSFIVLSNIADILLLNGWGTRVNQQALGYLKFPAQITTSINSFQIIGLFVGLLACFYMAILINRFVTIDLTKQKNKNMWLILIFPLILTGLRGSMRRIPLMISDPMIFEQERDNQLALNSVWNSIYQLIHLNDFPDLKDFKTFKYYNKHAVNQYFNHDSDEIIIDLDEFNDSSNVVIVIMEGVGAELSKFYKGQDKLMLPKFDKISEHGWAHTQAFASGDRTDKGIVSILSGWPGQPWKGILNYPETFSKLPKLAESFKSKGFSTDFYYGGNTNFMNLNTYLTNNGFENIYDENQIEKKLNDPSNDLKGKWGFNDSVILNLIGEDLANSKKQFLKVAMLSSTHEPFDILDESTGDQFEDMRLSVKKLDQFINDFIDRLKENKEWENTLLIVTSDHGKFLGNLNTQYGQRNFFHIPLLFTGGALPNELLKVKNNLPVSQCDILATLADLYTLEGVRSKYSRSLIRKGHPNNAWFNIENVGGLITNESTDWLSILPEEIDKERPLNNVDSVILSVQTEIISDFFKLSETFR